MPALVLDASVVLAFLLPGEKEYERAREIIREVEASGGWVPGLWITEVANGLLMAERKRRIDSTQAERLLRAATGLLRSVTIEPVHMRLLDNVHLLGRKHGLTAYDAAYLELAIQKMSLPLATFDTDLRNAAITEGTKLLPEPV